MPELESEDEFEFDVKGAELDFDDETAASEDEDTLVERVIFWTDDVPKGKVTSRYEKTVEKEQRQSGMPGSYEEDEMVTADELPANVKDLVRRAQDEEFTAVATVTKNEDDYYFILDRDIETLQPRLIQDDRE